MFRFHKLRDAYLSPNFKFPDLPEEDEKERRRSLDQIVGSVPDYLKNNTDVLVRPITSILCTLLDVPSSVADLLDDKQVHFFGGRNSDFGSMVSTDSVCQWHLIPCRAEMLVLQDSRKDARFRRAPAVVNKLLFCVGSPMLTDDERILGSLCVFDTHPRKFDASGAALLSNFTDILCDNLEFTNRGKDKINGGVALCDTRTEGWPILYHNHKFADILSDVNTDADICLWDHFFQYASKETICLDLVTHAKFSLVMARSSTSASAASVAALYTVSFWRADIPSQKRKITHVSKSKIYDFRHLYFARFERHEHLSVGTVMDVELSLAPPFKGMKLDMLLGRGGFGCVFRATYRKQLVAVKVMASHKDGSKPLEAIITSYGTHRNVLTVQAAEVVRHNDQYQCWMVMDVCENGSLIKWIDKGYFRTSISFYEGGPELGLILDAACQIAAGLSDLHHHGIVHADLNGNNILVTSDFVYKVCDFGLSTVHVSSGSVTQDAMAGTVSHMPLEVLKDKVLTAAVDIYSFGVVLYELFTSRRAWAGKRPHSIIAAKVVGETLEIPAHTPQILRSLMQDCMHTDYKARPQIDEVCERLQHMQNLYTRGALVVPPVDAPVYDCQVQVPAKKD